MFFKPTIHAVFLVLKVSKLAENKCMSNSEQYVNST